MRVVVTRPQADGARTAAALEARGHEVLLAPLLQVEGVAADLSGAWGGVIDARQQVTHAAVFLACFDADGALRRRRQEFFDRHGFCRLRLQPEPLQPGEREDDGVGLPFVQLAQARLDIAAQRSDAQIGPHAFGDRLPPRRRGAERGAVRQRVERWGLARDEHVARILAFEAGRQHQALRQ